MINLRGFCYLFVNDGSPESSEGAIVRIGGKDGRSGGPEFIDILNDDGGFGDGFAGVNENRDLLVNRVGLEKKLAFGSECFLNELVVYGFDVEGDSWPHHEWTSPGTHKLHVLIFRHC